MLSCLRCAKSPDLCTINIFIFIFMLMIVYNSETSETPTPAVVFQYLSKFNYMFKDFFDYHYYRIAKFYYKRDGSDAFTALLSVTTVQSWLLINVLIFFQEIFFNNRRFEYGWISWVVILIIVALINSKMYRNKYMFFRNKWINEDKNKKRIKGVIVIFTILFAWFAIFFNLYFIAILREDFL